VPTYCKISLNVSKVVLFLNTFHSYPSIHAVCNLTDYFRLKVVIKSQVLICVQILVHNNEYFGKKLGIATICYFVYIFVIPPPDYNPLSKHDKTGE
jgi:hypothetical protein